MEYKDEFREFVESHKTYLGTGNPNSKVLIIGKEAAIKTGGDMTEFERLNLENYKRNAKDWLQNIQSHKKVEDVENWDKDDVTNNNPLCLFKGVRLNEHQEGQTWRKYQKLNDLIFDGSINSATDREYSFQENFFITELNDSPNGNSKGADKSSIQDRKIMFKNSAFIQQFPVIILACSNYIHNFGSGETREIDNIFQVKYSESFGTQKNQMFWTHFNADKTKLVIHARQLSADTSNELLYSIAKITREFILKETI